MDRLLNKVALITGASQGIGRGIALCLAAEGADIVVNYRSHVQEALEVAGAIEALGRQVWVRQADVADREAVAEMFAGAVEQFGRVDIAIANAALSIRELVVE